MVSSLNADLFTDNTIIVYTSDHGDLMGDHGLILKGPCPFEGILGVPMLWKVPGLTKTAVSDSLVSSIDIPTTLLKLLKIKRRYHPKNMQSVDITPILKEPSKKIRHCCFIEEDEEIYSVNVRVRHLVTEDYKLTLYEGLPEFGDLFDRKNDPDEVNNLWYDENYKEICYELITKMFHENLRTQCRYPPRVAIS